MVQRAIGGQPDESEPAERRVHVAQPHEQRILENKIERTYQQLSEISEERVKGEPPPPALPLISN